MAKRKKVTKNTLLAKQKQVVNIFSEHMPKAQARRRPPRQQAQIVRTVYQNVPVFNPIAHHPQPVGTTSDAAIHALIKTQHEHKTRLDDYERRMHTPGTVSFNNREPHPNDNMSTVKMHTPNTVSFNNREPHPFDNMSTLPMQPRRLHDEDTPAIFGRRDDDDYTADGGGGTIQRLKKDGTPKKKPGPKPKHE